MHSTALPPAPRRPHDLPRAVGTVERGEPDVEAPRSRRPLLALEREHELVLRLTDTLDDVASRLADRPDDGDLDEMALCARLFQQFVDGVHYEREELILLPFIARHGFDWNGEVLSTIRSDHRQERYLIAELSHAAERVGRRSKEHVRRLAATTRALAAHQRALAMRQDIELFPEVTSRLDDDALGQLSDELSRFDDALGERGAETVRAVRRTLARGTASHRPGTAARCDRGGGG